MHRGRERGTWGRALASLALGLAIQTAAAQERFDYDIAPRPLAEGVWVVEGAHGGFRRSNGGNILNAGFIATDDGVIVIDPGPSLRYGRQLRAAVQRVTGDDVIKVFITHRHPDHALGAQAFADLPVLALPATRQAMADDGEALLDDFYRRFGDWMRDSALVLPSDDAEDGVMTVAGRRLRLMALAGHSGEAAADLAILDEATGVLFAGDLVFHRRAPTTPHADVTTWLQALDRLEAVGARVLVPGHGPLPDNPAVAIAQTRDWLQWLRQTLLAAADQGLSMGEALALPVAPRFHDWQEAREEFVRSVNHLYPGISKRALHWQEASPP